LLVAGGAKPVSGGRRLPSAFRTDAKPDRQIAAAVYQLGQLYESGRGVPVDPDRAVRLYKLAERLETVDPDIAQQASVAATKLINRMRQAEEP
jgi:TPR repeat protein